MYGVGFPYILSMLHRLNEVQAGYWRISYKTPVSSLIIGFSRRFLLTENSKQLSASLNNSGIPGSALNLLSYSILIMGNIQLRVCFICLLSYDHFGLPFHLVYLKCFNEKPK